MRAIILFQVGNIDVALDIFQQLQSIYYHFTHTTVFVSILDTLQYSIITDYLHQLKLVHPNIDVIVKRHKNKGMDIGPFLLQFRHLINSGLRYDVFLKVHTKTNVKWRNELLKPLIANVETIKGSLTADSKVGLVGAKKWVLEQDRLNTQVLTNIVNRLCIPNHYFDVIDYAQLRKCRDELTVDPAFYITYNRLPFKSHQMAYSHFVNHGMDDDKIIPHPSVIVSHHTQQTFFVGGTVFWARYDLFYDFFEKYNLDRLIYDAMEEGYTLNTQETVVHALERFLCVIPYVMNARVYAV
jgi:hypothetical protein